MFRKKKVVEEDSKALDLTQLTPDEIEQEPNLCKGVWHTTFPREAACPMCGATSDETTDIDIEEHGKIVDVLEENNFWYRDDVLPIFEFQPLDLTEDQREKKDIRYDVSIPLGRGWSLDDAKEIASNANGKVVKTPIHVIVQEVVVGDK